jgi:phospholipid transport system substrate-binding protein
MNPLAPWCGIRLFAVAGLCVATAVAGSAGRPMAGADEIVATQALQPVIDGVLSVLADPALSGPTKTAERRAALRSITEPLIDFADAARRALSVHWTPRTPAERDEFVGLFRDLVMESHAARLEAYGIVRVVVVGESSDEELVTVHTRVDSRQRTSVAMDYRMHRRDGRWLVYDVLVEGVSLVGNYREQFNAVIRTKSYAELIRRMKTHGSG